MSLIKCSECGKQVSDRAKSCPNCGNPIMYESDRVCEHCGGSVYDNATICVHCGKEIKETIRVPKKKTNTLASAGFVIGFISMIIDVFAILGILAVVLSTIGSVQIKNNNESGAFYAFLGFILGLISIGYTVYKILNYQQLIGFTFM